MKPTKPALNSFRKLISRKSFKNIGKGSEMGRVIIPVSEQDNSIRLPEVESTTTYSILKTEEMQGDLEIVNDSIKGSFKGMLFNKNGATLSIVPISVPTQSFTLNSTSTNGASVNFLSDGADWFIWGMMADGAVDAKATGDFGDKKEGEINNNVSAKTDEILVEQGLDTENPDPAVVEAIEESTQTETPAPVYPPDAPTLEAGEGYLSDGETTNSDSWVVGGSDVLPNSTITVTIYDGLNVEESSETITVGQDGTWTSTTDTSTWSDDTYTVSVIITNPNTGLPSAPTEITVTRDATPPVITISETSPYGFEVGNAGPTAPSATADDGSTVTNDWNETTLNALTEGQTATITYTATDDAGNVGTATLTVEAQVVDTGIWIEEDYATIPDPLTATLNNGILETTALQTGGTEPSLVPNFKLGDLLNSTDRDATYSIWFKKTGDSYSNDSIVANYFPIFGFDNIAESISVKIENGTEVKIQGANFANWTLIATMPSSIEDGEWHNLIISNKRNGGNRATRVLVDGQSLGLLALASTTAIGPTDPNQLMGIGFHSNATGNDAYSTGHFDAFEIIRNEGLMISQMIELFAAGRGNSQITTLADTPIGKIISTDLFNSLEKDAHGTAPTVHVSNDKRYSFGGAGGFAYHNGYKYDMFNFTDRLDATNSFSYSGSTRTFSIWFNASNVTGKRTLFSKFQSRHGDIGWFIRINNGVLETTITGDVTAAYGNGTTEPYIQTNTWYHLAVVFKSGDSKIYLDGALVKTNTQTFYNAGRGFQTAANYTKLTSTSIPEYYYDGKGQWDNYLIRFTIGSVGVADVNHDVRTDYFIGEMAYPEAYLDELSETEITNIYNTQNGTL